MEHGALAGEGRRRPITRVASGRCPMRKPAPLLWTWASAASLLATPPGIGGYLPGSHTALCGTSWEILNSLHVGINPVSCH